MQRHLAHTTGSSLASTGPVHQQLCQTQRLATRSRRHHAALAVQEAAPLPRDSKASASGKGFGTAIEPKATKSKSKTKTKAKTKSPETDLPIWERSPKICACGSNRQYSACCEKFHCGEAYPLTPETLMRSRFSAYVKHQVDFLAETTHEDNKAQEGSKLNGEGVSTLREDLDATCNKVRFIKLQLLQHGTKAGKDDDEAFVAFMVRFKFRGQAGQRQGGTRVEQITERSRFLRDPSSKKWSYVDGDTSWEGHKYG